MVLLGANPALVDNVILCKLKKSLETPNQRNLERRLVSILSKYFRPDNILLIDKKNSANQFCIELIEELILRNKVDIINDLLTTLEQNRDLSPVHQHYFENSENPTKEFLLAASQFSLETQKKAIELFPLTCKDYLGVVDYAHRHPRTCCLQDLLHHIVTYRQDCADMLILRDKSTCWEVAVVHARTETFKSFVQRHDPEIVAEHTTSMLMSAISKGRLDTVAYILSQEFPVRIDINAHYQKIGYTPLYKAIECDNREIVELLLSHGALPVHSLKYYKDNPYRPTNNLCSEKTDKAPDDRIPYLGGVREICQRQSSSAYKSPLELAIAKNQNHLLIPLWKKAFLDPNKEQPLIEKGLDNKLDQLLLNKKNFYNELNTLIIKAEKLQARGKSKANAQAICLHSGLKQEADYYFANPTVCSPQTFQKRCQTVLAAGYKSELVRHRGVKQILGAFALAISGLATLGIGAVVFILASKATTGKYLFFNHTDSKNTMDRIDSCVKQATA